METSKLKRFAIDARNRIKAGVENKLQKLGFKPNGEAEAFPQQLQGATLFRGKQLEADFYYKWRALYEAAQKKGVREVYEEVAYTWFNRLMAIRILYKNDLIEDVLSFDREGLLVPRIVNEARQGRFPKLDTDESLRLRGIIGEATKTYDQFVILITAFCHNTPIINKCFGFINDYTELLLPDDILAKGGFIDMLNHTDFITDDDYRTTELLGWLYQFYISERKDEVFAKKGAFESDEIPAATQIFTPNWIVKYMVQNTLGKIYLDHYADSPLRDKMKYLVESNEEEDVTSAEPTTFTFDEVEELKIIDPACGSGHILLEAFDLLYDMYVRDQFYSSHEAIETIFRCNLHGIDLDTRAKQLATFALLLKACQKEDSFMQGHVMPHVLDMNIDQESEMTPETMVQYMQTMVSEANYAKSQIDEKSKSQIIDALKLLQDADTLGSIMKFDLCDRAREFLKFFNERQHNVKQYVDRDITIIDGLDVILNSERFRLTV